MKEILTFLKELRNHNDREWFNSNKDWYKNIKSRADILAEQIIAAVAEADPEIGQLRAQDCTYRIYRDTRFSNDKTPYKTHIGIFVTRGGKKSPYLGYYLHIEPGKSFFACGTIGHTPELLKRLRQSIVDEIEEYREIIGNPAFRKIFTQIGEDLLKTAPKGFDKNWEFIDYLKPRNYCCSTDILTDRFLTSPNLIERLRPVIEQSHLFNRFMNYTVEQYLGLH